MISTAIRVLRTQGVWHESIKWLATLFICVSAFFITVAPELALKPNVFVGFLIGHIIWSIFTGITREWAMFALNIFFVFLDSYGVIIRL